MIACDQWKQTDKKGEPHRRIDAAKDRQTREGKRERERNLLTKKENWTENKIDEF